MQTEEPKVSMKTYLERMRQMNEWERLHPYIVPLQTALDWNDDAYEFFSGFHGKPTPTLDPDFFIRMHETLSRLSG